jgi:hypothetical protein
LGEKFPSYCIYSKLPYLLKLYIRAEVNMSTNNKKIVIIPALVVMIISVLVFSGLGAPTPVPSSVNLGKASTFGVLAQTLTNTNPTTVIGDVGSGIGGQTTTPSTITGTNHLNDAAYTKANSDLDSAINDANSRTCDDTNPAAVDLGGSIVAPGVHCIGGAASVTGTLTLNGPGVYIFKITGALNTVANSFITLTNGAQSNQVFWVVTGASTLGANSNFQGTIMGKAAMTIGANSVMNGRVLTEGPATISTAVITVPTAVPPTPDFSLTASSVTISQSSSGTSTITITPSSGFSSQVTFTLSGNPSGVTGTFSPNTASSTSTLT